MHEDPTKKNAKAPEERVGEGDASKQCEPELSNEELEQASGGTDAAEYASQEDVIVDPTIKLPGSG